MPRKRTTSIGILLLTLSVVLFFYFDVFRTLQTVWLITQVVPFEQEGDGSIRLLIIGDSTGYGTGATRAEETVAGYIGVAYPGLTIRNVSRNGAVLSQVHDQLEGAFKEEATFDIVLLQAGANNILQEIDLEQTADEAKKILKKITNHTQQVLWMSSGNVGGATAFNPKEQERMKFVTLQYREVFKDIAAEFGVIYIDLFVDPEDDVFIQQPEKFLAIDGLHPSSAGYREWFLVLQPELDTIINDLQSEVLPQNR